MCKESKNNALFKKRTESLDVIERKRERVISVDHLRGIVLMLDPVCTSENNLGQSNQAGQSVATSGCRQLVIPRISIIFRMLFRW